MTTSKLKVLITGASGRIGTVLCRGLRAYQITRLSYPWVDLSKYRNAHRSTKGHDVAIHLAWNIRKENFFDEHCLPDNTAMFMNVYKAAIENGLRRVIMASSVHADDFHNWNEPGLLRTDRQTKPASPYGIHKNFMESLGRHYADKGLEVVCVRFGSVNQENEPCWANERERAVFLHHDDCTDLIAAIIDAPSVPGGFAVVNGVSDTKFRIHDISNPFGWQPPLRSLA
jgi:uronate dehydrogenase